MSKLRRPRKLKARRDARIADYEKMCKTSKTQGREFTKPGSSQK
jgi:hypothetical protein